jgi:hypothetical protein
MAKAKRQRVRGRTRLSRWHQATILVAALRQAGLRAGDELRVEAAGPGRIVLARVTDAVARHAGRLTGVFPRNYLQSLRREWR